MLQENEVEGVVSSVFYDENEQEFYLGLFNAPIRGHGEAGEADELVSWSDIATCFRLVADVPGSGPNKDVDTPVEDSHGHGYLSEFMQDLEERRRSFS